MTTPSFPNLLQVSLAFLGVSACGTSTPGDSNLDLDGTEDSQSDSDDAGSETALYVEEGDGCRPSSAGPVATTDADQIAAITALKPFGGAHTFPVRFTDTSTSSFSVQLAPETGSTWVQSYTPSNTCPNRWALLVNATLSAEGLSATSATPQQWVAEDGAPPTSPWEASGTLALSGVLRTKAEQVPGASPSEARFNLVWIDGEVVSFELLAVPLDASADVDLRIGQLAPE